MTKKHVSLLTLVVREDKFIILNVLEFLYFRLDH